MIRGIIAIGCVAGCLFSETGRTSEPAPARPWLGLHVTGHGTDASLQGLESQLPELAQLGLNVLVLEVNYDFQYQSHPELRGRPQPITRAGASELVRVCRQNHIRLIPQFQCLGHQSWKGTTFPLLVKYPELDLTPGAFPENQGIYCREWNPLDPKVNQIVFPLMDELIDAFQADALHVGMDEVLLIGSQHSPSTRGKDPAEVFAKAVRDYHDHLVKKRGLEMLMWGDRLLDAEQMGYGKWEASECGTAPAIDLIPKDIILCDWHYQKRDQYPSIPLFLGKGFRVWPAGWRKVEATVALIDYSLRQDKPNMVGHLFTTWSGPRDFRKFAPLIEGLSRLRAAQP